MSSRVEIWAQDSKYKGLRIVRYPVEDETKPNELRWIDENGNVSFRYGRKELEMNNWIFMEIEVEKTFDTIIPYVNYKES